MGRANRGADDLLEEDIAVEIAPGQQQLFSFDEVAQATSSTKGSQAQDFFGFSQRSSDYKPPAFLESQEFQDTFNLFLDQRLDNGEGIWDFDFEALLVEASHQYHSEQFADELGFTFPDIRRGNRESRRVPSLSWMDEDEYNEEADIYVLSELPESSILRGIICSSLEREGAVLVWENGLPKMRTETDDGVISDKPLAIYLSESTDAEDPEGLVDSLKRCTNYIQCKTASGEEALKSSSSIGIKLCGKGKEGLPPLYKDTDEEAVLSPEGVAAGVSRISRRLDALDAIVCMQAISTGKSGRIVSRLSSIHPAEIQEHLELVSKDLASSKKIASSLRSPKKPVLQMGRNTRVKINRSSCNIYRDQDNTGPETREYEETPILPRTLFALSIKQNGSISFELSVDCQDILQDREMRASQSVQKRLPNVADYAESFLSDPDKIAATANREKRFHALPEERGV